MFTSLTLIRQMFALTIWRSLLFILVQSRIAWPDREWNALEKPGYVSVNAAWASRAFRSDGWSSDLGGLLWPCWFESVAFSPWCEGSGSDQSARRISYPVPEIFIWIFSRCVLIRVLIFGCGLLEWSQIVVVISGFILRGVDYWWKSRNFIILRV